MSKPTELPIWDETEVNVNPPGTTREQEGWLAPGGVPEKPAFEHFNYWQNLVYKWIKEINNVGILGYANDVDYIANVSYAIGSDGILYQCKINNGPGSSISGTGGTA